MNASALLNQKPGPFDLRFRLFGTPVRVKPMFWIMMAVFGWLGMGQKPMSHLGAWVLAGFLSVLIHELGHITAGRIFGYPGVIVLFMFGGGAIGEYLRARPWQRIVIALAGPAAGAILYCIVWFSATTWTGYVLPRAGSWQPIAFSFQFMAFMNLFWTVFNLLPVMPQDGGMVVKDLILIVLGKRFDRLIYLISFLFAIFMIYYFYKSSIDPDVPQIMQFFQRWTPPGYVDTRVRIEPTFAAVMYGFLAFQSLMSLFRREPSAEAPPGGRGPRMKIAVLSDSHNRVQTLARALNVVADRGISTRIHCGDLDEPEAAAMLPAGTHVVLGNCDTKRTAIEAALAGAGCISHGDWGHLDLGGKSIAFTHGHLRVLRELEDSDAFDWLFYGHTHVRAEHRTGRTRVLNPGALHRASPKGFTIVDLATGETEFVDMES